MQQRRLLMVCFLAITVAGFGLRFYRLASQSLWTDEVSSLETARKPLDQITQYSAQANNSLPTYFLLLRLVVGESGWVGEFRARFLSAVAGALSVPVFMAVVYHWRRAWVPALLAGVLLAVNPLHLWYSQEARAYALMLLFGLLAVLCHELARSRRGAGWGVLYVFCAVTALALHKTALVFPVACLAWDGWRFLREEGRWRMLWPHAVVVGLAAGMLALKSYPPPESFSRPGSILELGYMVMTFFGGYSFGPSLTEIQSQGAWAALSNNWVQVAVLGAVAGLTLGALLGRGRDVFLTRETSLLLLGIGVVVLAGLFMHFPFNVRYTLPALCGFLALLARLGERGQSGTGRAWLGRVALAGVIVLSLAADAQWYASAKYRKDDARGVAQWLAAQGSQVRSWTVLPTYLSQAMEWYLAESPEVRERQLAPASDQTTTFPPVPDVLILGRRHHILNPDQLIESYRAAAGAVEANKKFSGFEIFARKQGRGD